MGVMLTMLSSIVCKNFALGIIANDNIDMMETRYPRVEYVWATGVA